MKALFLTSSLGCSTKINGAFIPKKCDNSNKFVDKLRKETGDIKRLVVIASDPDNSFRVDSQANCLTKGLQMDGFSVDETIIVDNRYTGKLSDDVKSADMVFLCGGHVPTQNKYFKKINLKKILKKYNGVVVGQSAGSMNCSNVVYAQPESEEEFLDKNYQKYILGLGLTDIVIMPHMNRAKIDSLCGETTYSLCLKDSCECPHFGITDGGYVLIKDNVATAYGETVFFKDGKEVVLCKKGKSFEIGGEQLNQ